MLNISPRHPLVLGAGKSGVAAARLLLSLGGSVKLLDSVWQDTQRLTCESEGITCLTLPPTTFPEEPFDLVVTSPGIPANHPWILEAQSRNITLISELELAAHYWQGDTWAITGSKGKSSVVKCLADTLNQNNIPAVMAGNYGTPLSDYVLSLPNAGKDVIAITEVSSFQLEFTQTFSPRYAAILNLQPDHLDRHHTLENYLAIKRKIFQAQKPLEAKAFLPPTIAPEGIPHNVMLERFGCESTLDWFYTPNAIHSKTVTLPLSGYFNNPILGPAAALITAMLSTYGLTAEAIARGFETFVPLPHRVQCIGEKNGIRFIDDSKGTSLSATQAALIMCGPNLHLIAGGLLKESSFNILKDELQNNVKAAYIIGKETHPLVNAWSPFLPTYDCGTMEEAVKQAYALAQPGDTILLSPGAASFDQYNGMAARGDHFKACFLAL